MTGTSVYGDSERMCLREPNGAVKATRPSHLSLNKKAIQCWMAFLLPHLDLSRTKYTRDLRNCTNYGDYWAQVELMELARNTDATR